MGKTIALLNLILNKYYNSEGKGVIENSPTIN